MRKSNLINIGSYVAVSWDTIIYYFYKNCSNYRMLTEMNTNRRNIFFVNYEIGRDKSADYSSINLCISIYSYTYKFVLQVFL